MILSTLSFYFSSYDVIDPTKYRSANEPKIWIAGLFVEFVRNSFIGRFGLHCKVDEKERPQKLTDVLECPRVLVGARVCVSGLRSFSEHHQRCERSRTSLGCGLFFEKEKRQEEKRSI